MIEEFDFRSFNQKKGGQIRSAIRIAAEHRRRVKEGDFTIFLSPLVFAVAKDGLLDFLAHIPFAGFIIVLGFSFPISVYLFIFMWGRGKWKIRIVAFILSLFEFLPFISLIPWQTVAVGYAYHLAKKDAEESKKQLEQTAKAMPGLMRKFQPMVGHSVQTTRKTV